MHLWTQASTSSRLHNSILKQPGGAQAKGECIADDEVFAQFFRFQDPQVGLDSFTIGAAYSTFADFSIPTSASR
ncbi:hypothetical protein CHR55_30725 [Rhodococcus qingshengii]|uniref:Uncharacterized protein n=1 Tax=Rhodococcus qingshengii TaxID=334542 RepID=A0A2A5J0Z8_RHOSG|nr:hypothetical protein CHR55_30725 [Rhodococcus qingshengii]